MMKKICKKRSANVYLEYALVIGVVSLVFVAMNVYMKRGLQGKIADMSDQLISPTHSADSNPTANVTSNTTSTYGSNIQLDELTGGRMKLVLLENREIEAKSRIVDDARESTAGDFVAADRGYSSSPSYPTEDEIRWAYDVDYEDKQAQIAILKRVRDTSLKEAETLENVADALSAKGKELILKAGGLIDRDTHILILYFPYLILWNITRNSAEAREIRDLPKPDGTCRVKGCFVAAVDIFRSGKKLIAQAKESRDKATALRAEAQRAQDRIDELSAQIGD